MSIYLDTNASNTATSNFTITPLTASTVTVQVADEPSTQEAVSLKWEAVLSLEDIATSDGRFFAADAWSWRDLPLTLKAQMVTADGHDGADVAGRIDEIWKVDRPDLGEGVAAVMGRGEFDSGDFGQEIARLVKDGTLRGVSVDYGVIEAALRDPETGETVDPDDMELQDVLFGNLEHVAIKAEIMAATVVATPAFRDASIALAATAGAEKTGTPGMALPPIDAQIWLLHEDVLTASAAGIAPLRPKKDWFFRPEPKELTPLTRTPEGEVYGHLAPFDQCHTAFEYCELAPRSHAQYAYFHTGQIETAEGDLLNVGRITVGGSGSARGGHASIVLGTQGAIEHYDSTGCVGAYVRAVDGKKGIWLSGAVRSDAPAEKIRDMCANPPSGDWRMENGHRELVAALTVPVGGFPLPRYEAHIVATGGVEEVMALIATGYAEGPVFDKKAQRKLASLRKKRKHLKDATNEVPVIGWVNEDEIDKIKKSK